MAVISEPTPISRPSRLAGACPRMMLNIRGNAIPVAAPCISRPASSTEKWGASAHSTVAPRNSRLATRNSAFSVWRRFRKDDSGTTRANASRYPVVSHCTVEVPMPNSRIRVGKVTFMAVSLTTPENDISPVATPPGWG